MDEATPAAKPEKYDPEKTPEALPKFRAATAYELAYKMGGGSVYSFGLDEVAVTAYLRELATRIEKKEILLQACDHLTRTERENYSMTYLNLMFHEKKEST